MCCFAKSKIADRVNPVVMLASKNVTMIAKKICVLALMAGLVGCQQMPAAPVARATIVPAANAPAEAQTGGYAVLFDASHGETSGNADWVIGASRPDPLSERANPRAETDW